MSVKFCPECGNKLEEKHAVGKHQLCDCGKFIGSNPVSVNVVLLPIRRKDGSVGLLAGKRGIEPGRGKLSLPAGYHDVGETTREGAVRELEEELGVRVCPTTLRFVAFTGNKPNTQVIFCWLAPEMHESELSEFEPNEEVLERHIVTDGSEMAFSSHSRWIDGYLAGTLSTDPALIGL
jgi:ADP-ribose pyrophosphatase YjhB (NUDIX family)